MTPFDVRLDAAIRNHLAERRQQILEDLATGQLSHEEYKFWAGYAKCISDLAEFVVEVKDRIIKE
jgi:hypothetical protein